MREVYVWVPFEPWWLVVPLQVLYLVEPPSNRFAPEVSPLVPGCLESQKPWNPLPLHSLALVSEYWLSKVFPPRREEHC